jgi:hypothetical protein
MAAHVWHGFIAAYSSGPWGSEDASEIVNAAIAQLFDPLFLSEQEAAREEHREKHESIFRSMTGGGPPEMPPHMEDDGGMI